MIIYKDIFTGDELFSDSFPVKEFMNVFYKITLKMVTSKPDEIDESKFGANPSAEEACEQMDEGTSEQKLNVCVNHCLHSLPKYSKKEFAAYIKPYCKKLKQKLLEKDMCDEAAEFEKNGPAAVKYLLSHLCDYDVYGGESMELEGTQGFVDFEEDGITPFMLVFKHGVIGEKV